MFYITWPENELLIIIGMNPGMAHAYDDELQKEEEKNLSLS